MGPLYLVPTVYLLMVFSFCITTFWHVQSCIQMVDLIQYLNAGLIKPVYVPKCLVFNGPPSLMTLPFENLTLILSGIKMLIVSQILKLSTLEMWMNLIFREYLLNAK